MRIGATRSDFATPLSEFGAFWRVCAKTRKSENHECFPYVCSETIGLRGEHFLECWKAIQGRLKLVQEVLKVVLEGLKALQGRQSRRLAGWRAGPGLAGLGRPGLAPFTNESVLQELVSLYLADLDGARAARLGQAELG